MLFFFTNCNLVLNTLGLFIHNPAPPPSRSLCGCGSQSDWPLHSRSKKALQSQWLEIQQTKSIGCFSHLSTCMEYDGWRVAGCLQVFTCARACAIIHGTADDSARRKNDRGWAVTRLFTALQRHWHWEGSVKYSPQPQPPLSCFSFMPQFTHSRLHEHFVYYKSVCKEIKKYKWFSQSCFGLVFTMLQLQMCSTWKWLCERSVTGRTQ